MKTKIKEILDRCPGFEPSSECKRKLLGTRKTRIEYGGNEYPGFFSVDDALFNKRDKPAFISMVILQCVSLVSIVLLSRPDPMVYLLKIIMVGVLILIELLIAGYFHKNNYSNYVVARNKRCLNSMNEYGDTWTKEQEKGAGWIITRHNSWTILCFILLMMIAGAKYFIIQGFEARDMVDFGNGIPGMVTIIPVFSILTLFVFCIIGFLLWMSFGYYRNYKAFYRTFDREVARHIEGIDNFIFQYLDFLEGKNSRPSPSDYYGNMKKTRKKNWEAAIVSKIDISEYSESGNLLEDHKAFFNNDQDISLLAEFVKSQYTNTFVFDKKNKDACDIAITYNGLLTDIELKEVSDRARNEVSGKLLAFYGLKFQVMMHSDAPDCEVIM